MLPEFRPVRFPHDAIIWQLLYNCFYCQDICCFLAGQFVLYMAGVFETYNTACLFIAMRIRLLGLIIRQHSDPLDNFYIHGFLFVFLEADDEEDIFYYDISCGEFNMTFALAKIETTGTCNPSSNLDFVHFIWTNYERFTFGKYCLTFIPRDEPDLPRMVCLKHHRAESEWWRNDIHCPVCVTRFQTNLRRLANCQRPNNYPCFICLRQPPSLLASASHTLFLMVPELNRFSLTYETTYDQYYMALRSRRVPPTAAPSKLSPHKPTIHMQKLQVQNSSSLSPS